MENNGQKRERVVPKLNKSEKQKTANFNVNFKPKKDISMDVLDFYNTKLRKLHMIITIISLILFVFVFFSVFPSIKAGTYNFEGQVSVNGFMQTLSETALLDGIIILVGVTPYCFLSAIGVLESSALVRTLGMRYVLGKSFSLTCFLGGAIQVVAISLCVAAGLYLCKLCTKKNKTYFSGQFGINDIKQQIYEIKKDEKKVKEIQQAKIAKNKKLKDADIAIPYFNFLVLGVAAFVIQFVGIVITLI